MTVEKTRYDIIVESIIERFPKAKSEYLKAGYNTFDYDLMRLLNWFEKNDGSDVPSRACDEIWHNMILYTQKYFDWCEEYFYRIIHHVPSDKLCAADEDCGSCGGCKKCSANCNNCSLKTGGE